MESKNFHQGMIVDEALEYNLGMQGLENSAAQHRFNDSYNTLCFRPDWDGYLTLEEANDWYKYGEGQPLYVSLERIDLSLLMSLGDLFVNGKSEIVN